MERTPDGTPVGVDDPYEVAGVCDHLTDDGRCRYALAYGGNDPTFTAARRRDDYACHVGEAGRWRACPHYRFTSDEAACYRCGIEEMRMAHDESRPLLEEHHLQYGGASSSTEQDANEASTSGADKTDDLEDDAGPHEITVTLCRWCHAKVHKSIARIDDDASPTPEAIAEHERRRSRERSEASFTSASERYDPDR
ncbi:DUF7097 family protein [Halorubrum vacuolatum]|uniref:Uncharacterized protein n=1 Tax=Halorubrum vacuolatum TaxID=63740 RepID=A0A238ULQ4_HALVU|nr:hypothetical protein [Halorubrum vacuolatum]SNR22901.1 hypothetical protein SAMN06264855_10127 [Halorubrum vacuolatum]